MNRFVRRALFVLCVATSASSWADESDGSIKQYTDWTKTYYRLGIHPTKDDIRRKGKQLHFDKRVIDEAINQDLSDSTSQIIAAVEKTLNVFGNLANQTANSRSNTTRGMGKKVLALIDEVRHEQETRNVSKFQITEKALQALASRLAKRKDAEDTIIQIMDVLQPAQSGALEVDRRNILASVDDFFEKERDEDFDAIGYVKTLLDNLVNPYIDQVDTHHH